MTDVPTVWDNTQGVGDWQLANGDLLTSHVGCIDGAQRTARVETPHWPNSMDQITGKQARQASIMLATGRLLASRDVSTVGPSRWTTTSGKEIPAFDVFSGLARCPEPET